MRADALRRRERILTHARNLFAQHGGAVSLDQVAAESQVGIATLYRNFPSREALTQAVTLELIAEIVGASTRAIDRASNGDTPRQVWSDFIAELAGLRIGALTQALGDANAHLGSEVTQAQERALSTVDALLNILRERSAIRDEITSTDVIVAIGVITRRLPLPAASSSERATQQLIRAYVDWTTSASSAGPANSADPANSAGSATITT